ncbi:MAG: hypothetical protein RR666_04675, partial [Raoultibacter sp.]
NHRNNYRKQDHPDDDAVALRTPPYFLGQIKLSDTVRIGLVAFARGSVWHNLIDFATACPIAVFVAGKIKLLGSVPMRGLV